MAAFLRATGVLALCLCLGLGQADNKGNGDIRNQKNILKNGLPLPNYPTLTCTDNSWFDCTQSAKGVYKVSANEFGGGGMVDKRHFLTGEWSVKLQLPKGYSGGMLYTWYTMDTVSATNTAPDHAEIDFEFYGAKDSKGIMLALNLWAAGKHNLAQYNLPFDPAEAAHTYTIRWASTYVAWLVDGVPLRVVEKTDGNPFPRHAMQPQASVWSTPWTPLKPNYGNGLTFATYSDYTAEGCPSTADGVRSAAPVQCAGPWNAPLTAAQIAAGKALSAQTLINDFGWKGK